MTVLALPRETAGAGRPREGDWLVGEAPEYLVENREYGDGAVNGLVGETPEYLVGCLNLPAPPPRLPGRPARA